MTTIARTNYYHIEYDEQKNRVYYKVIGFWEGIEAIPLYLRHIEECLRHTKPNFTMLIDASNMEPHPPEIEEVRKQAQILAVKAGMKQAAEVTAKDFISSLQFDFMTDSTGFPKGKFKNFEEADAWLDTLM